MIKYFKHPQKLASVNLIFEGSNVETAGFYGCTHLLEHLMCKKLFKLENLCEANGIELNARTSPSFTQFYISGLDTKVKAMAQTFLDILLNQEVFSETEFKNEKNIIIQEWQDSNSNPEENIWHRFYQDYYGSPRVLGSLKDIKNITYKQLVQFYRQHFIQPLYCLVEQNSVWKVKPMEFKKHNDSIFQNSDKRAIWYPNTNNHQNRSFLYISDSYHDNLIEHYLIMSMLSDGLNSPLMASLRTKHQMVYNVEGNIDFASMGSNHTYFYMTTNKGNEEKLEKQLTKILKDRSWFNQQRFNQVANKNKIELEIMLKKGEISPLDEILHEQEHKLTQEIFRVKFSHLEKVIDFYQPKNFILYK